MSNKMDQLGVFESPGASPLSICPMVRLGDLVLPTLSMSYPAILTFPSAGGSLQLHLKI